MAKKKTPNEDQPNDSENFNESDDTFGLPEIEYEPIDRDKTESTETTKEESTTYESHSSYQEETQEPTPMEDENYSKHSYEYSYQEESSPVWPKALLIVVLILAVLGAGVWWFYYKPIQDEEERRLAEEARRTEMQRRAEQARADSIQRVENERQQRIADSLALANAKPAEGAIEHLSGRTGAYYVIAASNIDDDLLMDYARKLSSQGVSSKIIPPFGKVKFYRLAIAEGGTYQETQAKADNMKGEFGEKLWVLKY